MCKHHFCLLAVCFYFNFSLADIRPYNLIVAPTDEFAHYTDNVIGAPGYVDLGGLNFTTISDAYGRSLYNDDWRFPFNGDQEPPRKPRAAESNETTPTDSVLDIVVFRVAANCRGACDWPSLGVGKRRHDGSLVWCCSREASGLCEQDGRLLIDKEKFKGQRRPIVYPLEGNFSTTFADGRLKQTESGTYMVLYANCNTEGREILITGNEI